MQQKEGHWGANYAADHRQLTPGLQNKGVLNCDVMEKFFHVNHKNIAKAIKIY